MRARACLERAFWKLYDERITVEVTKIDNTHAHTFIKGGPSLMHGDYYGA